ncbi:hypothetical protein FDUTEX481_00212 [Tolypothrix sp. PCC 7601]|nr:hypothetical protein FDUTEX481_00212 [Tolypothrix sp. PCC 7601]
MPNDGSCFKPGNPFNALPPQCPMPIFKLFPKIYLSIDFLKFKILLSYL